MGYLLNYRNWEALYESKKLFEAEGSAYLREMDASEKAAVALAKDNKTAAGFTGYGTILQFLKTNEILFNFEQEEAADWILLGYIRLYAGTNWLRRSKIDGSWVEKVKADLKKWGDVLLQISEKIESSMAIDAVSWTEYQFNQSAKNPKNINTLGKISSAGLDANQGQYPADSNLEEICRYVNTYNLVNNIIIGWDASTGYEYGNPEIVTEKGPKLGYLDFKGGTFIDKSASKAAVLKNPQASNAEEVDIYLWSLKGYTPDITKTTSSTTKPQVIKVVGDKVEPTPIEAGYAPLAYMPSQEALNKLVETLNSVKEIGEITDLVVYGSASTEPINMGKSGQGKALVDYWREQKQPGSDDLFYDGIGQGMGAVKRVPTDALINGAGKVGIVTDPMASGNAFLAKLRGDQIVTYLKSKGFNVSKVVYQITEGAGDARFIRVSFSVQKPDDNTVIPAATVLKTVTSLGGTKDYAAVFKCKVADIDLF